MGLDDAGKNRGPLMSALDAINTRRGGGTVMPAGAGTAGDAHLVDAPGTANADYVTRWTDPPVARA